MKLLRLVSGPLCLLVLIARPALAQSGPVQLNSITPPSVVAGGPDLSIALQGAGFELGCTVDWNGQPLSTSYVDAGDLTATIPAADTAAAGSGSVSVINPDTTTSNALTLTITNPPASISSISPASVTAGGPDLLVTVNGANFYAGSTVDWNGAALATTFVSASQLTATIPAADTATAGTGAITVVNPDFSVSNAATFTITNPPASITSISPTSVTAGGPDLLVTVNGANFYAGSTVDWNGTALVTTFVSASQLTATIPAADTATAGTGSITVVNPDLSVSNAATFTITNPPASINSISPTSITAGGPDLLVTVNGANFYAGSTVDWNGTALVTTFVSASQLTATIPAADTTAAGAGSITVVNPDLSISNAATFTITNPQPVLLSVSPSSVAYGGPDLTVTLSGSNFLTGAVAQWNGTALATTFVSSSQLAAIIPAADTSAAGADSITVLNPDANVSGAQAFTVANPPAAVISGLSPSTIVAGGPAFSLGVTGTGFVPSSIVNWNGASLATTYVSASQLTATVPSSDIAVPATSTITVSGPGGTVSNGLTFTATAPVAVTAVWVPATSYSGFTVKGSVTLASNAPAGGTTVYMSATAGTTVPSPFIIPAGTSKASFTFFCGTVSTTTPSTITAYTLPGSPQSATISVQACSVLSISVSPTSVIAGNTATITVNSNGIAPAGGFTVTLSSDNAVAVVPTTLTIAAGKSKQTCTVQSEATPTTATANLMATGGGTSELTPLTVTPNIPALINVWTPTSSYSGFTVNGSVTLAAPAPSTGATVYFTAPAGTTVPASISIASGVTKASFTFVCPTVSVTTPVTITAYTNPSAPQTATISVLPCYASSVTVSPTSIIAGNTSTLTVNSMGIAPSGGFVVSLSSNNPAAVVPASVTIPAGKSKIGCVVTSAATPVNVTATLTATGGGASPTTTLTVIPNIPALVNVWAPASGHSGYTVNGSVTLAAPAPTGGAIVYFSATAGVTIPASITIAAGVTKASYSFVCPTVAGTSSITITAWTNPSSPLSTTMPVLPCIVSSVSVSPLSVVAGQTATGTVVSTGIAPVGGFVVGLGSTNPVASVPATVTIPAGKTKVGFYISTYATPISTSTYITATGGGTTYSAPLGVTPTTIIITSLPTVIASGQTVSGTVSVGANSPPGGTTFGVSTNSSSLSPGAGQDSVPPGSNSGTFSLTAGQVTTPTNVQVNVTFGSSSSQTTVTITPSVIFGQAATRCYAYEPVSYSNGTDLSRSYRIQQIVPSAISGVELEYGNFNITAAGTESNPGNPITITAGFEYNGKTTQVTFGGASSVTIPPGALVMSDILPVSVPAGATVYSRSCAAVASSGQKWPYSTVGQSTDSYSNAGSDLTTATGAMPLYAGNQYIYGPCSVQGGSYPPAGSVTLVGDSIMQGVGDASYESGFAVRALGNIVPWQRMAEPGTWAEQWAAPGSMVDRLSLIPNTNNVICELGTNDLTGCNVAQIEANLTTLWDDFVNQGAKVYQTTLTPKTKSMDNWQTVGNQTPLGINIVSATNASPIVITTSAAHYLTTGESVTIIGCQGNTAANGTFTITVLSSTAFSLNGSAGNGTYSTGGEALNLEANRVAVNDWIRTVPVPLAGIFDTDAEVEVNSSNVPTIDGGYWISFPSLDSGSVGSATTMSLTDPTKSWKTNAFTNVHVVIVSGTGAGETSYINSNTATHAHPGQCVCRCPRQHQPVRDRRYRQHRRRSSCNGACHIDGRGDQHVALCDWEVERPQQAARICHFGRSES